MIHSPRTRASSLRLAVAFLSALLLTACGSTDEDEYVERPPEALYNDAYDAMLDENYDRAAQLFDEVERQHPYSSWATQAQLMAAYSYYQRNKYDDAIIALDRFIELHPGHEDVAYAYYLKALSYYEQITDVERDQRTTKLAFDAFGEVIRRFPNTDYARDATLKIDLARDHLAGKEMEIGRYYQNRGYHLAAINRYRRVLELYQTTTHVPEALHRLTECYLALGVPDEAQAAAAVLGYNFPGSEWYQDSYALLTDADLRPEEKEESWISSAF
ncbi:outer membrane protein assembly factor BamD [Rhodospirillaceae bacterium SYSU D60014]|uniref:outer membrane protein assembly factor BamD n=1 Tax=Virgifigura deserti TaxID=2268457 RepID=UPI000E672EE9